MDKINIKINNVLSHDARLLLKDLLTKPIRSIFLYGSSKGVSVADSTTFYCREIDIITTESNSVFQATRITQTLEEDYEFGEYATLDISNKSITKVDLDSMYKLCQIFFEIPKEYTIENIEVYGLSSNNLVLLDDDFPERRTIHNIDTNCILKLNFNIDLNIIIQSKGGSLLIGLNKDGNIFSDYIKMTQKIWGLECGYFYKYTVDQSYAHSLEERSTF